MLFQSDLLLHKLRIVKLLLLLIFQLNFIQSRPINATKSGSNPFFDNGIVGEPLLVCGAGHISFKFATKSRFLGRVFLKGMSSNEKKEQETGGRKNCEVRAEEACLVGLKSAKSSSSANTTVNEAFTNSSQFCSMRMSFDGDSQSCPSLRRRRIIGPRSRGMQVSATVVVSFHPHFITQLDKIYRLQCFYSSEGNKEQTKDQPGEEQLLMDGRKGSTMSKVKTAIHVQTDNNNNKNQSDNNGFPGSSAIQMPICRYEILENYVEGPLASLSPLQAKQPKQLYHKWTCEISATEKQASGLCFRVHSCLAESPTTSRQLVILDKEGCSLDNLLLNNLQYSVEESNGKRKLVAGQFSQVYRYTDQKSLYLQCQIMLWRLPVEEFTCPDYNNSCPEPKNFGGFQQVLEGRQVFRPRRFLDDKENLIVQAGNELRIGWLEDGNIGFEKVNQMEIIHNDEWKDFQCGYYNLLYNSNFALFAVLVVFLTLISILLKDILTYILTRY